MGGLIRWILKTFAPYAVGIGIGVGFFFLLLRIVPGPAGEGGTMAEALSARNRVVAEAPASVPAVAAAPPVGQAPAVAIAEPPAPPTAVQPPDAASSGQAENPLDAFRPPATVPAPAEEPPPVAESRGGVRANAEPPAADPPAADPSGAAVGATEQVAAAEPSDCGPRPLYQGAEMTRHVACVWRRDCLSRLAQSLRLVEQGRARCPASGPQARACQDYHDNMARQYQPALCQQGGVAVGW